MHGLQEIIALNSAQKREVNGHLAAKNHSEKLKALRDKKHDRQRRAAAK